MNREIGSARRVFIFADLRPSFAGLEEALRSLGYFIVATARSGKDALEKIEDARPDLVLMDIRMQSQAYERGSSSGAQPGLGLGMFIADEIVKAHGGTMQVQSNLGAGSAFTVQLPRICGNGSYFDVNQ